jgi:formyltetrahydrofolate deformylase
MQRSALLFQCNDKVGIIAGLVTFFRDNNVSISRFEEYTDSQYFFARLEWTGKNPWETPAEFGAAFQSVADQFEGATFRVHFFDKPQRLGLFSSREPHTLIEAINRCEAGEYPNTEICFLISNSAEIQRYAQRHDIPFHFVKTWKDPKKHEPAQLELIQQYKPDLIGLAR